MGGNGSGRRWGYGGPTCDSKFAIDVRRLARNGWLKPGVGGVLTWHRRGQAVASIKYTSEDRGLSLFYDQCADRIEFAWTCCHLGGERIWFRCPGCRARVAILYFRARWFRCRRCHGLTYAVQRESQPDRALRQARNIRVRLGGAADLTAPFPVRPRYMRHRRYDHLRMKAEASETAWVQHMAHWTDRLRKQIRR